MLPFFKGRRSRTKADLSKCSEETPCEAAAPCRECSDHMVEESLSLALSTIDASMVTKKAVRKTVKRVTENVSKMDYDLRMRKAASS